MAALIFIVSQAAGMSRNHGSCMIDIYDYAIIAFYLIFMVVLGVMFRRLSKNTSDYFRAGGAMPWWLTGVSAWIASFSAWTFTGAAGEAYKTGALVLCLYYSSVIPLLIVVLYTCRRFRRLRVVSYMEAVRQRFGPFNEQFYTWIKLPLLLILGGVGLNAVGVFMAAAFNVHMVGTLITLGALVTIVSFAGGAWAVLASDFVQMLLIVTITLLAAFLALREPQVGGIAGLIRQLPPSFKHPSDLARPVVIAFWALALLWINVLGANNFEAGTPFLMVKSDRDARRMAIIPVIGTIVGPIIYFIPALVARVTHPNMHALYPQLVQPSEAAFVVVCKDVMPRGVIALLICAMFGATLSSMDAGLNKGAGIFIRSFYMPIVAPAASEKRLLYVGKACTLAFGIIIIIMALLVNQYRTGGLFDLTNQIAASLGTPLVVPLAYGIFIKKTPAWSAWSTVLVGFVVSVLAGLAKPEAIAGALGWSHPLNRRETIDFYLFFTVFADSAACTLWFIATMPFYRFSTDAHKQRVEHMFANMNTPINAAADNIINRDAVVYRTLARLCLAFGTFVLLLMAIPNSFGGRLCFLYIGGVIAGFGLLLLFLARRADPWAAAAEPDAVAVNVPLASSGTSAANHGIDR